MSATIGGVELIAHIFPKNKGGPRGILDFASSNNCNEEPDLGDTDIVKCFALQQAT
jgi:hypothetical protein